MLSVVIPAYNEEGTIAACLDSLVHQQTKQRFEVIIVDNNSTDKTAKISERYKNKLTLRIIAEKQKGRGPARAAGFTKASGDIICSTDADTQVPANWIDTLVSCFTKPNIVAVTGTMKISDCNTFINTQVNLGQPLVMKLYRLLFGHYWLSGFNFAIRKDTYKKSGGFNTKINGQEDIELSRFVSKLGLIAYTEQIPVLASGRRFKKGVIAGTFQYVLTFIRYFYFHDSTIAFSDVR